MVQRKKKKYCQLLVTSHFLLRHLSDLSRLTEHKLIDRWLPWCGRVTTICNFISFWITPQPMKFNFPNQQLGLNQSCFIGSFKTNIYKYVKPIYPQSSSTYVPYNILNHPQHMFLTISSISSTSIEIQHKKPIQSY